MKQTNSIFKIFTALAFGLSLFACNSDKHLTLPDPVQGQSIEDYVESQPFSGSVMMVKNGEILLSRGFGLADRGKNTENRANTGFLIGSVTKQFTAMAMLILQERGQLSLDDPLSLYLPDFPKAEKITLTNLLNMSSGIVNYTALPNFADYKYTELTPQALIAKFSGHDLEFEPGSKYQYSNSNYVIAGFIIESVTGLSYAEFIEQEIFLPLGMANSGYGYMATNPEFALGYADGKPVNKINMTIPYAAGALASTAEDLYKWHIALNQRLLISEQSTHLMFTPFLAGYALGWSISTNNKGDEFHQHSGGIDGFSSYLLRSDDLDYFVVVLSNDEDFPSAELANKITSMALSK
ncbi:serine hydrolase domain-containing protein [Bowmanella yangjiangensis]|uniref:Beta-lactamase family protein n=1 Tax=Bowmanella yangjiangensis TaxID=2811230 RepID=A0ABS3CVV4_9ALTE|nr:serine hydrolase domain-containing protein [Bowmanella yangjiangensis]MBN7820541.1 beta-lactamase family protein [Bowmanella yangjiangensis]